MKSKFFLIILSCLFSFGAFSNTITMDFNEHLNSIVSVDFPQSDYFPEVTNKTQVCLHHTASGKGVKGDLSQFLKPGKIATPIIVGHSEVYRLHSTRHWGYHLGIKKAVFKKYAIPYQNLNKTCIGLEIDNWGPLKLIDGEYRAWVNDFGEGDRKDRNGDSIKVVVDQANVITYDEAFRGYQHYERYTEFQIESVSWLLKYWADYHDIPLHYNSDMWDVSENALKGSPGIYTHVSYRSDKSDCHPQPELIEMLNKLNEC